MQIILYVFCVTLYVVNFLRIRKWMKLTILMKDSAEVVRNEFFKVIYIISLLLGFILIMVTLFKIIALYGAIICCLILTVIIKPYFSSILIISRDYFIYNGLRIVYKKIDTIEVNGPDVCLKLLDKSEIVFRVKNSHVKTILEQNILQKLKSC